MNLPGLVTQQEATEQAPVVLVNTKLPAEQPLTFIRLPEVLQRTGLSRSTIYDKLDPKSPRHDPTFPKRRNLGSGSVGWLESEINDWLSSR
jgi:prophage regulatory protein